jgi:hypothetical protein
MYWWAITGYTSVELMLFRRFLRWVAGCALGLFRREGGGILLVLVSQKVILNIRLYVGEQFSFSTSKRPSANV